MESDALFDAIQKLIDTYTINNQNGSITKIGIIYNADKRDQGIYTVLSENVKFETYGEANAYQKDDQVRIIIPNNDMSGNKYIEGLDVIEKTNIAQAINITGNLLEEYSGTISMGSNYIDISIGNFWNDPELNKYSIPLSQDILNLVNVIQFKVKVKTINHTGNFELHFRIAYRTQLSNTKSYLDYSFSNKDMIGNTECFLLPTPQEFNIFLQPGYILEGIYCESITEQNDDTLQYSDLYLSLGIKSNSYENQTLLLNPKDNRNNYNSNNNIIDINTFWYNLDSEGKFIGYSNGSAIVPERDKEVQGLMDQYNIVLPSNMDKRYTEEMYLQDKELISLAFEKWEEKENVLLEESIKTSVSTKILEIYDNLYSIHFFRANPAIKASQYAHPLMQDGWENLFMPKYEDDKITMSRVLLPDLVMTQDDEGNNIFYLQPYQDSKSTSTAARITLDINQKQTKIKAILFYNHTKIESMPLVYDNTENVISVSAIALEEVAKDDSQSNKVADKSVFIYSADGTYSGQEEELEQTFKLNFSNENMSGVQVEWIAPKPIPLSGMVLLAKDSDNYEMNEYSNTQIKLTRMNRLTSDDKFLEHKYRISKTYNANIAENNKIVCQLSRNGQIFFEKTVDFEFLLVGEETSAKKQGLSLEPKAVVSNIDKDANIYNICLTDKETGSQITDFDIVKVIPIQLQDKDSKNPASWEVTNKETKQLIIKSCKGAIFEFIIKSSTIPTTAFTIAISAGKNIDTDEKLEGYNQFIIDTNGTSYVYNNTFFNTNSQVVNKVPNGDYLEMYDNNIRLTDKALKNKLFKQEDNLFFEFGYNNNKTIYWPIYIRYNYYFSSLINNWNEQAYLDTDNNSILSQQGIFGHKNAKGIFSGIICGSNYKYFINTDQNFGTGIKIFNEGVQTANIDLQGNMYLGGLKDNDFRFIFQTTKDKNNQYGYITDLNQKLILDFKNNQIFSKGLYSTSLVDIDKNHYRVLQKNSDNENKWSSLFDTLTLVEYINSNNEISLGLEPEKIKLNQEKIEGLQALGAIVKVPNTEDEYAINYELLVSLCIMEIQKLKRE